MAMSLKDLVKMIDDKIKSHQWEIDKISDDFAVPMMTIEEMSEECRQFGEIDENDIRNINVTFWESGITADNESFVESMVAHCLFAKCKTDAERKSTLDWLTDLQNNVCLPIVKKLNRWQHAKKKIDRNSLYGEFTKFDLIQRYGFLYDSDAEANQDANDKSATCPLLIGFINSGWQNFLAVEDKKTGKITVSKRLDEDFLDECDMFLSAVQGQFESVYEQEKKLAEYRLDDGLNILRNGHEHGKNTMCLCQYQDKNEKYIENLAAALFDEETFPQTVYDFQSVHTDFLKIVSNALEIIENLDSTQHDLARELYKNTLENMRQMADFECHITHQQYIKDPITKQFVKPRFDCSYLGYCGILADILRTLEGCYDEIIMRMPCGFYKPAGFRHPLTDGLNALALIDKYCNMQQETENQMVLDMAVK